MTTPTAALDALDQYDPVDDSPCELGYLLHDHVKTIRTALANTPQVLYTKDLTQDDFMQIFVDWKNQSGMNAFPTHANKDHIRWVFQCLEANGLIITAAPKGGE